jgi:epsin
MSLQTFGKGALRVAKNYTKGYSDVQAKVREATSNDPWGPSGTQMNEIAQMTYNQSVLVSHDLYSANTIHAQKRLCRNNGDAG